MSASFRDLIRLYGVDPKKSLGQNFLVDETHLSAVIAAADLSADDNILEIGPGLGVLTRALADAAGHVVAVELDDRLIDLLRAGFGTRDDVTIVHGDILELDPPLVLGDRPVSAAIDGPDRRGKYKVVANLPYYITSPVLRRLLEAEPAPERIVVMVQKEVAERVCARPGDLSVLGVSVQFYAEPKLVHRVPAGAFYPRPKVDSAVLCLDVRPQPAVPDVDPERFFAVVRAGFGQKRKQLLNSLSHALHQPKPAIKAALSTAGIDPTRRAQTLSLAEWGALVHALG